MEKRNMTTVCNRETEANKRDMNDWGFSFLVDEEIVALRIAYAHRYNKHGLRVEHCPTVGKYLVTVFNEFAAKNGINK